MPDYVPPPADPLDPTHNWWILHAIKEKKRRNESFKIIRKLCKQLREIAPQFKELEFEYNGSGDEGDWSTRGEDLSDVGKIADIYDKIQDVLDPFLPEGYENNDGGEGTLILDVTTLAITVEHADFERTRVEADPVTYRPEKKEKKNGHPVSPRLVER